MRYQFEWEGREKGLITSFSAKSDYIAIEDARQMLKDERKKLHGIHERVIGGTLYRRERIQRIRNTLPKKRLA